MNLKEQMENKKSIARKNNYSNIKREMKKRIKLDTKRKKITDMLIEFVKNNIREYIIITLIFLIGIFLGVMFVNNLEEIQKNEIISYVNTYIEAFKQNDSSDNIELFLL